MRQIDDDFLNAVDGVKMEKVKSLLAKGADVLVRDRDGSTALHCAIGNIAFDRESLEMISYLVELGVDVNAKNDNIATALHYAAQYGHSKCLAYLIGRGVDIDVKDKDGKTPLHFAASNVRLECIEILISRLADPTITDNMGYTALDLAEIECGYSDREEDMEVVVEMIEAYTQAFFERNSLDEEIKNGNHDAGQVVEF